MPIQQAQVQTSAAETGDSMDEENPDDTVDVDQSTEDDDDIMNNVNSDVLGDNVIEKLHRGERSGRSAGGGFCR